jgi:ribosomal protein S18 acetylase RimI-like enzyme
VKAELRPPRREESAAIAALMSRHAPEPVGVERLHRMWSAPGVDMERESRVAVQDGAMTGFAGVYVRDEYTWLELHGGVARELIDWAVGVAPGRIYSGGWEGDDEVRAALLDRDFTLVRHSYRMAIEVDGDLPEPAWPKGINVRSFTAGDERAVYEAHQETFEDTWEHTRQPYEEWAHWTVERPGFEPTLWRLAFAGDDLAGIALCRRGRDEEPDTGWVSILGVRRPWRRLGLGTALLQDAFATLRDAGLRRAVLGVDASSLTGAHRLYESAGMRVVSTFDVYERPA